MFFKSIITAVATFFLTFPIGAITHIEDKSTLTILTPSLASRKTAKIVLDNGLTAYLISDANTKVSGAALSVDVGSFSDPKNAPGMAHFVEHMLFMGTQKYPDEAGFHSFLSLHEGKLNAFTTDKRTVYIFSIENSFFDQALDQFAHFFIDPLFRTSSLAREWHAVDEEFQKYLTSDGWRLLQVKKDLANHEHPFHTFCIGNESTLSQVTTQQMSHWFDNHYSANLMHLVVYSPEPLEVLLNKTVAAFSAIKNRHHKIANFTASLFPQELGGKLISVKPEKPLQRLELIWELPRRKKFNNRTEEYLATILGHEGENSLLSLLKKEGLATAIATDINRLGHEEQLFLIAIDLTDQGLLSTSTVLERTFEVLRSLSTTDISESFYDELASLSRLNYSYQERKELFDTLSEIAYHLPEEPIESFPDGMILPAELNSAELKSLAQELTPQKGVYFLIAPPAKSALTCDCQEPWMKVRYGVKPLEPKILARLLSAAPHAAFKPPKSNPFIPQRVTCNNLIACKNVEARGLTSPAKLIVDAPNAAVYFAADERFGLPQICFNFNLKTPVVNDEVITSCIMADLFAEIIEHRLTEASYEAKQANLTYNLEATHDGFKLHLSGFADKAPQLLSLICNTIKTFESDEAEFELYRERLARYYEMASNDSPLTQARELFRSILHKNFIGKSLKSEHIAQVCYPDFRHFTAHLFDQGYLQATCFGDIDEKSASDLAIQVSKTLFKAPYARQNHRPLKLASLADQPTFLSKKSRLSGNALLLAINLPSYSIEKEVVADILSAGLEDPFFNELRTRQNTAYLVKNGVLELEKHLYMVFLIQSSSHHPRDLLSRFELFFEAFLADFKEQFSKEKFEALKESKILELKERAPSVQTMGDLIHTLAFEKGKDFDYLAKKKSCLENLTYEQFVAEVGPLLGKENQKRLGCAVVGKKAAEGARLFYQSASSADRVRKAIDYQPAT